MSRSVIKRLAMVCGSCLLPVVQTCFADEIFLDRIYDPYVQPLETELELRSSGFRERGHELDGEQRHLLAIGHALSERVFAELGVEGEGELNALSVSAWEGELKWQLTEQGEYAVDWGLLLEAEAERQEHVREVKASVILLKEWSRWVGTANAGVVYEYGNDIDNEWETLLGTQLRYRRQRGLEPGVELFMSQGGQLFGPMLSGQVRLDALNKLHWQTGVYAGLNNDAPELSWRLLLEYEFY